MIINVLNKAFLKDAALNPKLSLYIWNAKLASKYTFKLFFILIFK